MRRPTQIIAILALLSAGVVLAAVALQPAAPTTPAARSAALAGELRCPDCQALSVAESKTAAAGAIRAEVERLVADGRSDDEIRRHFIDRYGEWILLAPPNLLVWLIPVLALLAGVVLFVAWSRWRREALPPEAGNAPPAEASGDLQRIREELEALDG